MDAISLHQPWATWVAVGWKTIETRTHDRFKRLTGRRIVIHSARKIDKAAFFNNYYYERANLSHSPTNAINLSYAVQIFGGKLLCTAKVADCRWAPDLDFEVPAEWNKQAMCDVAGKFCIFLDEIKPLVNRIPFRGRQGIFHVPNELIEEA